MFASEEALTQSFDFAIRQKESPFAAEIIGKEFDYREGRTDVVVVDTEGRLLAFEMKLRNWRQALKQAYRNLSFSNYSYIVVPESTARRAAKHEREFVVRGVGLCFVQDDNIQIEIVAKEEEPLRPWLTQCAREHVAGREVCPEMVALRESP